MILWPGLSALHDPLCLSMELILGPGSSSMEGHSPEHNDLTALLFKGKEYETKDRSCSIDNVSYLAYE